MRKSEIVGRKVKLMPNCLFYSPECPNNNQGVVVFVGIGCRNKTLVNVADHEGCIMPCYLHELRYLNNKEVVLHE